MGCCLTIPVSTGIVVIFFRGVFRIAKNIFAYTASLFRDDNRVTIPCLLDQFTIQEDDSVPGSLQKRMLTGFPFSINPVILSSIINASIVVSPSKNPVFLAVTLIVP